jgi:uncharacterized protein (DUF924 family)
MTDISAEVRAECIALELAFVAGRMADMDTSVPILKRKFRIEYWMARVASLNARRRASRICAFWMTPLQRTMAPWDKVLAFWFGEAVDRWFSKDPAFDDIVRARFGRAVHGALAGKYDSWTADPKGALALVVLLDQMTRNAYRGTPEAYRGDARALEIARSMDTEHFTIKEKLFAYLPFEHSEDPRDQLESMTRFRALDAKHPRNPLVSKAANYARKHAYVIRRFGRFPHRNAVLGRQSTDDEIKFMRNNPHYSF